MLVAQWTYKAIENFARAPRAVCYTLYSMRAKRAPPAPKGLAAPSGPAARTSRAQAIQRVATRRTNFQILDLQPGTLPGSFTTLTCQCHTNT